MKKIEIEEKKISINDVFEAIREELSTLSSINKIGLTLEKIEDLLGQLEELIDKEIEIPRIKCPACVTPSGITKGCPICSGTGIIYNASPVD